MSNYPPQPQPAAGYPAGGYPTPNLVYPPQVQGYPAGGGYPTPNQVYPPQVQPYPAQPPPPAYQPPVGQQAAHTAVVVKQQPVVSVTATAFRDYPVTVTDSNGQQVQTVLEYRAGLLTWLVSGIIFVVLLELGLCWLAFIPFLIRDLKDVYHITPTDGKVVGIYKRLT